MKRISIITFLLLLIPVVCFADEYNIANELMTNASDLPISSALANFIIHISATAKLVSAIMIMVTGLMLMFGELSQTGMHLTRIVISISILVHIGAIVSSTMFPVNELADAANAAAPQLPQSMTSDNFMGNFMDYYIAICKRGAANISKYLYLLIFAFGTIDIVWTLALRPEQDIFKYLISNVFKIGFFVFLVANWINGEALAHSICSTFEFLAQIAAGQPAGYGITPDQIFNNGYKVMLASWTRTLSYAGLTTIGLFLLNLLITVGVVLSIILTSLYLLLARLEFWTMAIISVFLVPFGMLSQTKFLFEKAIGAIFNCSVKVGAINFISFVAFAILTGLSDSPADENGFGQLLRVLLSCALVAVMVIKCPTLVQGLISGNPSLSTGDYMAPVNTAKAAATGGMAQIGKMSMARAMAGKNTGGIGGTLGMIGRTLSARTQMGLSSFVDPYHDAITRADSRLDAQGKHQILKWQATHVPNSGAFDYSKTAIYQRMRKEGTKTAGQDVSGNGN